MKEVLVLLVPLVEFVNPVFQDVAVEQVSAVCLAVLVFQDVAVEQVPVVVCEVLFVKPVLQVET